VIAKEARRTVNEEVYFQIKRMIATGELASGTSLTLRPLAAKLGVSKMPVIEAIRRLERDGLVVTLAKWGATVKEWSHEEILEATYIRRGLEAEAARLFVERASKEDKQKLVDLGERFDMFALKDPMKCEEADMELHLHVVRSTQYPRLYELVENSKIETTTCYGLQLARNDPPGQKGLIYKDLVGVHQPVIEALLGTDPDAAALAMWQHISAILKQIMR
jgi:DNA-binding GntR family transcriptional regulator